MDMAALRDAQLIGGDACPMWCGVVLEWEADAGYEDRRIVHPDPQCGWIPDGYPSTRWGAESGKHPVHLLD